MSTSPTAEAPREEHELEHHPSPRKYVWVAIILAIVTGIEVAIYYIDSIASNHTLLITSLLVFAVIKFVMVGGYFMHLKYDSPIFRRFFITGLVLAMVVFGVVLWYFFSHGGAAPATSA
jgi:caa(3)-type oxidase subunit IV